jgi:lipopolysaccharide export system protein LptA
MNRRLRSIFFPAGLTVLLLSAMALLAQAAPGFSQKTPIHIEADRMTSLEKQRAVVFSGHVKARQGELLINSDEMTVYHAEQKAAGPGEGAAQAQIDKMYAKGHVKIVQNDFVATGDEAEYFSDTGKVVITGNAKIIQNNNMVTGHRVEMDLNQGSTVIVPDEGKQGRVKGYFYPANADDKEAPGADGEAAAPVVVPAQDTEDASHGDTGN